VDVVLQSQVVHRSIVFLFRNSNSSCAVWHESESKRRNATLSVCATNTVVG
jgi:hypothetical protein